jgi:hypothetical protein
LHHHATPITPDRQGLSCTFTIAIPGTLNVSGNRIQALPELILKRLMKSLLQHGKL